MPTYEYRRKDGSIFEIRQGINEDALKTCPETGQPVTRIISGGGGVVYKGEGWYVKEYGSGGNNAQKAAEKNKPKDSGAKEERSPKKEAGNTEPSSA